MSWSLSVKGNADVIREKFEETIEQSRKNGMNEGEIADIEAAAEFATEFAGSVGRDLEISAGGSWMFSTTGEDAGVWNFGEVYVRVKAA
jgi:hypothetical protein